MRPTKIVQACAVAALLMLGPVVSAQPPKTPDGFVPVEQLPAREEIPAAPLVAAAYGIAWAALLIYVWSLWQRLAKVERELTDVAKRIEPGARR